MTKYCRLCNTRLRADQEWLDNYCCIDHRDQFQARQHQQTIERLRREEPEESELALHGLEPRRVRLSMLSDTGAAGDYGVAGFHNTPPIVLSPQVPAQPLVAPPLQPKASVEQSLAALSFVAEPVSEPLDLQDTYAAQAAPPAGMTPEALLEAMASPVSEQLGASVRRRPLPRLDDGQLRAQPAREPASANRNRAIVDMIRGAQKKLATPEAPVALGVPSPPSRKAPPPPPDPMPNPPRSPISNNQAAGPATPVQRVAPPKPRPQTTRQTSAKPAHTNVPIPGFLAGAAHAEAPTALWKRPGVLAAGGILVAALSAAVYAALAN